MLNRKNNKKILEVINSIYFVSIFITFASICGGYECNNYTSIGFVVRLVIASIILFIFHEILEHVNWKFGSR